MAGAAASVLDQLSQLLPNQIHHFPDSNAWAANGPAVAGASADQPRALLGGDPHLPQTLPSVWYEVALSAPGYQAAGVSVPGVPGVLLGHNAHIAWSLTDTQNSATFYYKEQVRGSQYYWNGAWRPLTVVHYSIPVRGGATRQLTVDITAHGPIISQAGQTMAVDWMGNVPSDDVAALFGVNTAATFAQFKAALAGWHAPTQNFVYADTAGNIGVIAPGYYPQVPAGCQPWLPMPGTGACDITGVIPYQAVPQAYDPPSHLIATDNQRPVSGDYPYYVGTALDFYDPGYRAAHAYSALDGGRAADDRLGRGPAERPHRPARRPAGADGAAGAVRRRAVRAGPAGGGAAQVLELRHGLRLGRGVAVVDVLGLLPERRLRAVVAGRKGPGEQGSASASRVTPGLSPLDEDLEAWTLGDPSNAAVRRAVRARASGHGGARRRSWRRSRRRWRTCRRSSAARPRRGRGGGSTAARSRRSPGRTASATARARRAATRSPRTPPTAALTRPPARAGG